MRQLFLFFLLLTSTVSIAQDNLEDLLAAGIEDAQKFAAAYISPATEGMIFNNANGWIQSAEVKSTLKFDISIVGNATFVRDKHKKFTLNTTDYNNLHFRDGSTSKEIATGFGENNPDVLVYAIVKDGNTTEEVEFKLPQGLASVNVNIMPTAFLQGRLGLFKGTELKVRYFPKVKQEDVKIGLFGLGLQHEFTNWLPAEKLFPVAISGFIAYNSVTGSYDFTSSEIITGNNQRFELKQSSWLFQLQASTKFPVLNFYGGLGYVTGTSDFDVLGNYRVKDGVPLLENTNEFTDPFSVKNKVSGVRGTIGANLRLGFFGLHADYNIGEFNNASVGLHFGI